MDTFESVRTVLAVRAYQDKPLPAEAIQRIVDAAHLTASASNRQPWHFIVVQDKAMLKKLGELAATGPYVAQAPLAIVVIAEDTPRGLSDTSRAIQSMVLTAWADGIGSNWVGFAGMQGLHDVFGIPADQKVIAILPFGYPVKPGGKGKKNRKPIGEVVHREMFGRPYA